jgi:HK97 gp10 family phage protein
MSVEIEIHPKGPSEFRSKMERLDTALKRKVQQQLADLARSIRKTAQRIVPVRTGYLRLTIFAELHDWTIEVGASAPYAAFVEFGTRRMSGRRFLAEAISIHIPQLKRLLNQAVGESLMEVSS